ncbi:tripartite tricarboxylate transporter substrate binding protein [Roseomonas nepalensis]|uniref:Tripartite tricarboxylate transporter substrate binding protein n=1 Tax=Muricoccus nepalensis TaxID=1854500 RepID=A0A502GA44_9PROT|nr:tripartite tricarboxylate transporter substrate-binding protein [Roseomonas nepalensis]TPG58644.1 tripartite tricarboxylate transporter substrate binding protein [Roseomonas nepalensis]
MRWIAGLAGCVVAAFLLGGQPGSATAETDPARGVRLVNPFPPGSPVDLVARLAAEELQKELGQFFVVENRAGAGGTIGAGYVAKARPDGYTLLVTSSSTQVIAPVVRAEMPYDPVRDFRPILLVAQGPVLIVAHPSLPVTTLRELVDRARQAPESIAYGSSGTGTILHLAGELFQGRTGTRLLHVPFNGAVPASTALLGGQVGLMFDSISNAAPGVRAGQIRALAVMTPRRFTGLPDVPTAAEAGMPGLEFPAWIGVFAPAGTPDGAALTIERALRQRLSTPAMTERMLGAGLIPELTGGVAFAAALPEQIRFVEGIAASAGVPKQ